MTWSQLMSIFAVAFAIKCVARFGVAINAAKYVKIKGNFELQQLPVSMAKSFKTWTFENSYLEMVEDEREPGWVTATSFDELFLPSDIPFPKCRPAIAVAIANGALRYVMPSVVLSLQTPDRHWRNRGLCTLPRANAWIDLFAPLCPPISNLRLNIFGQYAPDVRFLEDQDGTTAWTELASFDNEVAAAFESFKSIFSTPMCDILKEGYHFVDILIDSKTVIQMPRYRMKGFLADFGEPIRLLGLEDSNALDFESCAEIDIFPKVVSPARESKFMPEVYQDLFEEGNIVDFD